MGRQVFKGKNNKLDSGLAKSQHKYSNEINAYCETELFFYKSKMNLVTSR